MVSSLYPTRKVQFSILKLKRIHFLPQIDQIINIYPYILNAVFRLVSLSFVDIHRLARLCNNRMIKWTRDLRACPIRIEIYRCHLHVGPDIMFYLQHYIIKFVFMKNMIFGAKCTWYIIYIVQFYHTIEIFHRLLNKSKELFKANRRSGGVETFCKSLCCLHGPSLRDKMTMNRVF